MNIRSEIFAALLFAVLYIVALWQIARALKPTLCGGC